MQIPKDRLNSIPRPEVVKRNRPDGKTIEAATVTIKKKDNVIQIEQQAAGNSQENSIPQSQSQAEIASASQNGPQRSSGASATDLRKEILQGMNGHSRPSTPQLQSTAPTIGKESPHSSPAERGQELVPPVMAPPIVPSQTLQAQELRSSRSNGRVDKVVSSPRERQREITDSPLRRSPSPATRPGTRNASADSRTSSGSKRGRSRRERASPESEDKKRATEGTSRAERTGAHREVLQGRAERGTRERIPGSSTRDADREREIDQERRRDRDRDKRDRSDRESRREHRERDRDKADRDKERDRHRRDRDEKDRERKSSTSKEVEPLAEHGGTSRSESNRHRNHSANTDESLGKRRRPPDDEVRLLFFSIATLIFYQQIKV